jgi:hypothetical protein
MNGENIYRTRLFSAPYHLLCEGKQNLRVLLRKHKLHRNSSILARFRNFSMVAKDCKITAFIYVYAYKISYWMTMSQVKTFTLTT